MIQDQVIPIDFGGGVDTKTDPKLVVPGKFLRLENAVFTSMKRASKRNGYGAFTNVTNTGVLISPALIHAYKDELIAADQRKIFSYSPSQSAWIDRANYVSTEIKKFTIDQDHPASGYTDCAVTGNYALYGWSTAAHQDSNFPLVYSQVFGSVVDLQTGTTLVGPVPLSTTNTVNTTPVRCVVLGASTLGIVYPKSDYSAIVTRIVSFAGGGSVSFGPELSISTNFSGTTFDIVNTSSGAVLLYRSSTGITIANISTTGTVSGSLNITDSSAYDPLCISVNNGNYWIYWTDSILSGSTITACSVVYAVYSASLSTVLAKTTIVVQSAPYTVTNMMATTISSTEQTLYFGQYLTAGGSHYTDETQAVTIQSNGTVGNPSSFAYGVLPYSKSFDITQSGLTSTYSIFAYRGVSTESPSDIDFEPPFNQPTFFCVQLTQIPSTNVPLVVARFGYGQANSQCILRTVVGFTPGVSFTSSLKTLFACGLEIQEFLSDFYETQPFASGGLAGAFSFSIDFNSENSYRAVNCGELAVLNGGVVQVYDGQACTEFGFHLFPEISNVAQSQTTNGAIANGKYSYISIFQWTDAQGNLHQSAPSITQPITTSGTNNTVTVTVTNAFLSQKTGVSVSLYRTSNGGTVYFLVTDPVFLQYLDPSGYTAIAITDMQSDADIAVNPQAYTYPASAVLENSTPPPSMIMVAHNNRLQFVDSENPNTYWYTKSFQPGVGLSPSALMNEQIDPKFGDISALAEIDDKIVVFKQRGFFVQSGDGVNDTGTGSSLSFPQSVPSDVGCSKLKSVITTPNGVLFQSPNGIYMVDRSLSVSYAGSDVEAYNSQSIVSAQLVPTKSQIRFLVASGLTLVYDYIFQKWSTFTNHTGVSSTVWQGSYLYATTSGLIFKETPGVYSDNGTGFAVLAQTSWLALASVQGFQRVRRLAMLGDFINGLSASHGIQIQASYDFSSTFQTAVPYIFGSASTSGALQYRERLPQQKCDTISLLIQEVITGDSAEYIDLTNMSFEAGVKKGLNKMAAGQSVG